MESLPLAQSRQVLKRHLCPSCQLALRYRSFHHSPRLRGPQFKTYIARAGEQANPLKGYYADLLDQPLHQMGSATRTPATPPPKDELPKTQREETLAKARIVFGSKLAGPIERRQKIESQSRKIAGIMVPPKPEEPDNCCMSGCVNCVWDQYRDDLEEWATQSALARENFLAQAKKDNSRPQMPGTGTMVATPGTPTHVATSMDDDGGGSDTNWDLGLAPSGEDRDLFGGIPVGIREFMKTEKALRDRHRGEDARAS